MSGGYLISPRGVERLRGLLRGSAGATSPTYVPAAVSFDDFAAPFTVEWHASEDGGDGAWCIWLPDAAKLVMRGAAYVTPTGITAATELPSGWYTMDDVSGSDTEVWLVVTKAASGSGGAVTAEITNASASASSGEEVSNILIAKLAVDSTTGARRVKQFVDSAVTLGVDIDDVMLLSVDQTVNSDKTWATSKGVEFNGKYFLSSSIASPDSVVRIEANNNNALLATASLSIGPLDYIVEFLKICGVGSSSMAPRLVVGGTTSDPIVNAFAVLGYDLATNPDSNSVDFTDPKHGRLITSVKWVRDYFVRKSGIAALNGLQVLTGWEFDTSTHKIKVKTKTLSVADGVISVGQEATTQIDTTPISSIVS